MRLVRTARGVHGGGRLAEREFPAFRTGTGQPGTPRRRGGRHRRTADGTGPRPGGNGPAGNPGPPAAQATEPAGQITRLQGIWPALRFAADEHGIAVRDEFGAEVARGGSVAQVQAVLRDRVLASTGSQFPAAWPGRT
jgi:hypothetical protein